MGKNKTQQILGKVWREIGGLIIAAIGWIFDLGWLSSTVLTIVGIIIFGFFAFKRTYEYEERIDSFENARPNIIPTPKCGVYPVNPIFEDNMSPYVTTHTPTTDLVFGTPGWGEEPTTDEVNLEKDNQAWFALVYFHNKPLEPTDNSVAREVSATITYYDKDCKPKIKDTGISGRWWSNPEVARSDKSRRELERTDIYPGPQGVILALACMGTKESAIYGYNNENHRNKEFKKQEFVLGLKNYNIHVVLSGIHLRETDFWFTVWRGTSSGELKIQLIDRPDCMKQYN